MSEHKKTITAISWCPGNPDLFASASADNLLIIWNVAEQKAVARLDNTKGYYDQGGSVVTERCSLVLFLFGPLCFPRCPHIGQLVLELIRCCGVCVPAWTSVYLGIWGPRCRGHGAQRSPLLPVWYLPLQMASQQEGQTGVWTHRRKPVHISARYGHFFSLLRLIKYA